MQNSTTVNIDEFDLSGNREQPRNNVYVVSEENIDFLEQPEDELPAGFEDRTISKSFTRYDPRVINLLSGKRTKVKNESDVQQKLFKLLSINELDQAILREFRGNSNMRCTLLRGKDGQPVMTEYFNFGKHKGKTVAEVLRLDPGYYAWIMGGDFTYNTKQVLTRIRLREAQH